MCLKIRYNRWKFVRCEIYMYIFCGLDLEYAMPYPCHPLDPPMPGTMTERERGEESRDKLWFVSVRSLLQFFLQMHLGLLIKEAWVLAIFLPYTNDMFLFCCDFLQMLLGILIKENMSSPNILTVCKLCYRKQKGSKSHWSRLNSQQTLYIFTTLPIWISDINLYGESETIN